MPRTALQARSLIDPLPGCHTMQSFHVINETVIAAGDLKKGENEAVTLFGDAMPLKVGPPCLDVTLVLAACLQRLHCQHAEVASLPLLHPLLLTRHCCLLLSTRRWCARARR